MDGRRRIMLGSNNYLGLTTCPEVVEAGIRALEKYGTGCSGSRFLNGTLDLHLELEAELADFLGKEEALTFGTGFQTNLGVISALVGRHDYRICDKEAHASVYCAAQMCLGKFLRFRPPAPPSLSPRYAICGSIPNCRGTCARLRITPVRCFANGEFRFVRERKITLRRFCRLRTAARRRRSSWRSVFTMRESLRIRSSLRASLKGKASCA